MPLLKIDADDAVPVLHGAGNPDTVLNSVLDAALAQLPPGAPVVVMIHGFKFAPGVDGNCPHRHILSLTPDVGGVKAVSWPRHLGFGRDHGPEGLCIAFGWNARGTIWQAWRQAAQAGVALADLLGRIQARRAGPVDMLAHSLGARVALAAMGALPAHSIGRAVLMMAAEYQSTAAQAMLSAAGRTAEVFNVTSRENDLFDALAEWAVRAPKRGDRTLGAGLGVQASNWIDIQFDCPEVRNALAGIGYRIPPPARRICHWSAYLRPGLFGLYRDLFRDRNALPLACLRSALPQTRAPRWTRLRPLALLMPARGLGHAKLQ